MTAIIEATPVVRPAMTPLSKGESCVLIIFAASGDLTRRKLMAALSTWPAEGAFMQLDVLGVGRTLMTSRGNIDDFTFDGDQLNDMKKTCQKALFLDSQSQPRVLLQRCARVIKWMWENVKRGFRGGVRSFED
jgi:hypothetical protein